MWGAPYTQAELDEAQARFGLRFPPDLVELLRKHRIAEAFDWTRDEQAIRSMLAWPFEGLLFDVQESGLWWPEWGLRPEDPARREAILREVVAAAPKLIPLCGHRYLPESPHQAGNPVFSVYQADTIYYGHDLAEWVELEFEGAPWRATRLDSFKTIQFWTGLVERGGQSTRP